MAMTITSQSLLAKPVLGLFTAAHSSVSSHMVRGFVPRVSKRPSYQVLCTVTEDKKNVVPPQEAKPQASIPSTMPISPPPKPKASTKFSDMFAFGGPAPERINGRLAMFGFAAAMTMELMKGTGLFTQITDGGVQWFIGTTLVLSLASLIPLSKGVAVESKTEGPMNSNAELWNGRVAMLGLVALAFTEFVKGGALL